MTKERSWQNFSYAVPSEVAAGVSAVRSTVDSVASIIEIVAEMSRAAKLLMLANSDPLMLALSSLIDQLTELLRSLYSGYGTHLLVLPVLPTGNIPKDLLEIVEDSGMEKVVGMRGNFQIDVADYPILTVKPPNLSVAGSGGNWGFYQEFSASIYDAYDPNRPVYPLDSYVAGVVLLSGARSLGSLLTKMFRLYRLMSTLVPTPPGLFILPIPQNLSGRLQGQAAPDIREFFEEDEDGLEDLHTIVELSSAALADEDTNTVSVSLRWDGIPILENIKSLFTGVTYVIKAVRVYMSKDSPISDIASPDEYAKLMIFDTTDVTRQRLDVNGIKRDGSITYYFAVGYKLEITEPDRTASNDGVENGVGSEPVYTVTTLEHYGVSNTAIINPAHHKGQGAARLSSSNGVNWTALNSPLGIFPPLLDAILSLQDILAFAKDNILSDRVDEFTEYIDFLTETSEFYLERVDLLVEALEDLQRLVDTLAIEGYIYPFAGRGGSRYLLSEVNAALFGDETRNKPPYTDGGDFVSGIVLLAASTGASTIDSFISVLDFIFGPTGLKSPSGGTLGGSLGEPGVPAPLGNTGAGGLDGDLSEAESSLNVLLRDAEISVEKLEELAGITGTPVDYTNLEEDLGGSC